MSDITEQVNAILNPESADATAEATGTSAVTPNVPSETRTVAELLATLPVNSTATYTNVEGIGPKWRVTMGRNAMMTGEGRTLGRAMQMVGAYFGPHPDHAANHVLLDQSGMPLGPEDTTLSDR